MQRAPRNNSMTTTAVRFFCFVLQKVALPKLAHAGALTTHCTHANKQTGVFMLFFIRSLLEARRFVHQSELKYCRLRLALDLASTVHPIS